MAKMRRFYTIILGLILAISAQAKIGVGYQMQLGNPSNAKADSNDHEHYLIQRSVFALDYDDHEGEPNWVSWDLTAEDIGSAKRSPAFHADTELPASFNPITSSDYRQSGFDRGHMCPSADRTDNAQDNDAVFTMANIIPQTPDNNQGVWEHLEAYCRDLAKQGNELLIISGPVGFKGEHLAHGKPLIPAHTWKIVVVVSNGSGSVLSRITPSTRVIAVDIPNIQGVRSDPWNKYVVPVNQLEALTSYHFFTALAPDLAAVLKAKIDGQAVPTSIVALNASEPVKALPPPGYSPPPKQQPLWIPVTLAVLTLVLVLCIGMLIVFFKTRPKNTTKN